MSVSSLQVWPIDVNIYGSKNIVERPYWSTAQPTLLLAQINFKMNVSHVMKEETMHQIIVRQNR